MFEKSFALCFRFTEQFIIHTKPEMRKSILTFDLFFVASTFVCLRGGVSFHFIVLIAFWIIGKATHSPVGAFYYEHRLFFFPLSRR